MQKIVHDLMRKKMNWRMRFLWASLVAVVVPIVFVVWAFCWALIDRIDEVMRWLLG
nr:MAG TPA: vesicle-associated membrane protein 2 [Caudoviricetes sp.]